MNQRQLEDALLTFLKDNILIVGIGNELRADDGVGPELIKRINTRIAARCIDAGMSPENYIGAIIKLRPELLIFIDACNFNASAGTIKLIHAAEIPLYGFSTHNMSPKLMIENIASQVSVTMLMIGIQPKSIEFAEGFSREVLQSISVIESTLIKLLGHEKTKE